MKPKGFLLNQETRRSQPRGQNTRFREMRRCKRDEREIGELKEENGRRHTWKTRTNESQKGKGYDRKQEGMEN